MPPTATRPAGRRYGCSTWGSLALAFLPPVSQDQFTGLPSPKRYTSHKLGRPQQRLFALDSLGEGGWLKAMRLEGYAPRAPRRVQALQEALFPYAEAL